MTIITPETPDAIRLKMSGRHMLLLILGVLLTTGSQLVLGDIDYLGWGLAALAAGISLILVGAVGLGRSIRVQSAPIDPAASRYPAHLEEQLDPALSQGLWLVKWLLALPHHIMLAIL